MILASFDLSFFTSIPGMLITGGVLLLLIALIIFIATGSKDKKKNNKAKDSENDKVGESPDVMATPNVDAPIATSEAVMSNDMGGVNTNVNAVTPPVIPVENTVSPVMNAQPNVVVPTQESVAPNVVMPTVDTNNNASSVGTVNTVNAVSNANTMPDNSNNITESPVIPSIEVPKPMVEETPSIPVVTPVGSQVPNTEPVTAVNAVNTSSTVNPVVTPDVAVSQSEPVSIVESVTPKMEEAKPIYGGVSSVIPNIAVDGNQQRRIYGGANPLENTQNIPVTNVNTNSTINRVEVPREESIPKVPPVIDSEVTPKAPVIDTPMNPMVTVPNSAPVSGGEDIKKPVQEDEIESLF